MVQHEAEDDTGERLLAAARNRVRRHLPGAFESADPVAGMWTFAYGQEVSDLACMMDLQGDRVRIGFYDAEELPDPAGLLVRWSTRHRYLYIESMGDLDQSALDDLLSAVRARHEHRSAHAFNLPVARAPAPLPRKVSESPATEALVCLLVGLVVGAMFAAALNSTTFGLVLGLVIATALLWVRKAGDEGTG
jgi:hypothetical protein